MRRLRMVLIVALICSSQTLAAAADRGDTLFLRERSVVQLEDGTARSVLAGAPVQLIARSGGKARVRLWCFYLLPESPATAPLVVSAYFVTGTVSASSVMTPDEAVEHFTRILARTPNDPSLLLARSMASATLGGAHYANAVEDCDRVIAADPANACAWLHRGVVHNALGRYREAAAACSRAIDSRPTLVAALVERAAAYSKLGRLLDSVGDCDEAIRLQRDCVFALIQRSHYLWKIGQHEASIEDASKVLAMRATPRELLKAHYIRALDYLSLNDCDKAIEDLNKALQYESQTLRKNDSTIIRPIRDRSLILCVRGDTRATVGDIEGAFKDVSLALEIDPQNSRAYYARGWILIKDGKYERAIPDFDRAIELAPFMADAYYFRGLARVELGEFDKAIEDLSASIELARDRLDKSDGLCVRAKACRKKGDLKAAERDLTRAIELAPRSGLYSLRANVWKQLGNDQNAAADLQTAESLKRTK